MVGFCEQNQGKERRFRSPLKLMKKDKKREKSQKIKINLQKKEKFYEQDKNKPNELQNHADTKVVESIGNM